MYKIRFKNGEKTKGKKEPHFRLKHLIRSEKIVNFSYIYIFKLKNE